MRPLLVLTTTLALASSGAALAQSNPRVADQPQGGGVAVGPATGRPDVPPEPPSAEIQQPGKEIPPQARASQPSPNPPGAPAGSAKMGMAPVAPGPQPGSSQAGPAGQGSAAPSSGPATADAAPGGARPHVITTHELKQSLAEQGFSDARILAESFVVQAMKDGKRVTMVLGPHGVSTYEVLDENGLQDDMTGTVQPDAGSGEEAHP